MFEEKEEINYNWQDERIHIMKTHEVRVFLVIIFNLFSMFLYNFQEQCEQFKVTKSNSSGFKKSYFFIPN